MILHHIIGDSAMLEQLGARGHSGRKIRAMKCSRGVSNIPYLVRPYTPQYRGWRCSTWKLYSEPKKKKPALRFTITCPLPRDRPQLFDGIPSTVYSVPSGPQHVSHKLSSLLWKLTRKDCDHPSPLPQPTEAYSLDLQSLTQPSLHMDELFPPLGSVLKPRYHCR